MAKTTLHLSPPLSLVDAEANAIGVSLSALLTTDIVRLRTLAAAATPQLGEWEWGLLSHVLDGIEAHHILTGDDCIPSPGRIVAEIDTWADDALDDAALRAGRLRNRVLGWSPLAILGVLLQLRAETVRAHDRQR